MRGILELRVENLDYVYSRGTPLQKRALEGIHFTLPSARVLGILGGTGSGKTTLIRHFNGLLTPTAGRVLVGDTDTRSSGPRLRHEVGLVFQRPERQLFEETVYGDISFVLRRFSGLEHWEIREKVGAACALVGLNIDVTADRSPIAISEGERRKAAIAGILVNEPEMLVLDEPLVGLDPPSIRDLVNVLAALKKAGDRTLVIVSHDVDDFLPLLDFLLVLDKGRQAAYGTVMEVCESLGNNAALRCLLPPLALLAYDLDKAGHPLTVDNFETTTIAEQLTNLLIRNGGAG